jgi:hypothetical protein
MAVMRTFAALLASSTATVWPHTPPAGSSTAVVQPAMLLDSSTAAAVWPAVLSSLAVLLALYYFLHFFGVHCLSLAYFSAVVPLKNSSSFQND